VTSFKPNAKIIADSIAPNGKRLTTLEVEMHRFVLAEFNTHRVFSRNSASSRAIPFKKMRDKALNYTAYPVSWPAEQRGMQGGEELSSEVIKSAKDQWATACKLAVDSADKLYEMKIHKSIINRLLEPFIPHKAIVTATEWDGFYEQRLHPDAQPEIQELAKAMKQAMDNSNPVELNNKAWHVPYIDDHERIMESPWHRYFNNVDDAVLGVSAARCARVSYETHDGVRDVEKDFELAIRLRDHKPAHASPFEHIARPIIFEALTHTSNFKGWEQYRGILGL
jgi:thymidylate synthase ThyX